MQELEWQHMRQLDPCKLLLSSVSPCAVQTALLDPLQKVGMQWNAHPLCNMSHAELCALQIALLDAVQDAVQKVTMQ